MEIRRHFAYLKYVLRHKYYVLGACPPTGASIWRGLVHDLSKFLPSEWFPYAKTFYDKEGKSRYFKDQDFDTAWLLHQRRNPHHWQYWVLLRDNGSLAPLRMPEKYAREMVADWIGAGIAITGRLEVQSWYEREKTQMQLHPDTQAFVERLIPNALSKIRRKRVESFHAEMVNLINRLAEPNAKRGRGC